MTLYRLKQLSAILGLLTLSGPGQLNLLTQNEAQGIVEKLDQFVYAERGGQCPVLDLQRWGAKSFWITIRAACSPITGQSIGVFIVNRETGVVTLGESEVTVGTETSHDYSKKLVGSLRDRLLTLSESKCLAESAVRIVNPSSRNRKVTLHQYSLTEKNYIVNYMSSSTFASGNISAITRIEVDRSDGSIRDVGTGFDVYSNEIADLITAMRAARVPTVLFPDEAAELVTTVPRFLPMLTGPCWRIRVTSGDRSGQYTFYALPQCEAGIHRQEILAHVDMRSGRVSDPSNTEDLSSSETFLLRERFRARMNTTESQQQDIVRRLCSEGRRKP